MKKEKTESEVSTLLQTRCVPSINSTRNQAAVTVFLEVVPTQLMMSEAEARQQIESIKLCFDDITALLLELDDRRGWEALKYKSLHQMIQAELKDYLNKSVSQIYRKLTNAKIRRELSQICEKVEAIPAYKLEPLSKLSPEQWQDTWQEVTSTAPEHGVTREHVQVIVSLRLQGQEQVADFQEPSLKPVLLHPGDWVEVHSFQGNKDWDGLRGSVVEPEDNDSRVGVDLSEASGQSEWMCIRFSPQELIKVPAPLSYNVGEIVMIQCDHDAKQEQRKHSGSWGIVSEVLDSKVILAVGGELVQYPLKNLDRVKNPSITLRDVCDRVTRLWSVPNLPSSVQLLLSKFYQRELIFPQSDLDVLQAIERLYQGQEIRV